MVSVRNRWQVREVLRYVVAASLPVKSSVRKSNSAQWGRGRWLTQSSPCDLKSKKWAAIWLESILLSHNPHTFCENRSQKMLDIAWMENSLKSFRFTDRRYRWLISLAKIWSYKNQRVTKSLMMAKFGGVDKCPACQKSVYPMEKVLPACICIYVSVLVVKTFKKKSSD